MKRKYRILIKIHNGIQFNFIHEPPSATTICIVNGVRIFRCAMLRNSPVLYDKGIFDYWVSKFKLSAR